MFLNTKFNGEAGFGNPTFIFVSCVNLLDACTEIWLHKQERDKTISKDYIGLGVVFQYVLEQTSHREASWAVLHTMIKTHKRSASDCGCDMIDEEMTIWNNKKMSSSIGWEGNGGICGTHEIFIGIFTNKSRCLCCECIFLKE